MALGLADPERLEGVEQATQALRIGHLGTGRRQRDARAAWHLLARRRELIHGAATGPITRLNPLRRQSDPPTN